MGGNYGSYKRIHKSSHASDLEKGKISRETARAQKAARNVGALGRRISSDPDDDAALDDFEEQTATAQRESRNAKGHKKRLRHLMKDEDFV